MAQSFDGLISDKLRTIRNTHRDDTKFNTDIDNFPDKASYPAAQIVPQNTSYQNDLEYNSGFAVRYIFSSGPKDIDWIETFEEVEDATDTVLADLETDTTSKEFKPVEFNPLVAENQGTRLSIIEVTWQLTNLQDFT